MGIVKNPRFHKVTKGVSPGYTAAQFFAELLVALQAKCQPQTPDDGTLISILLPFLKPHKKPQKLMLGLREFMCFFVVGIDFF